MLFCRCGCVTKPRSLCLAGSLATKLKSQVYSKVSEVTLGPFLVFFCYVLGTKLGAVLPLRMRHKAMQLVLCRLAGYIFLKSGFRSDVRPFFWWDSRTSSSFRAMVFPRPAAPIFCSVSRVSEVTLGTFLVGFSD